MPRKHNPESKLDTAYRVRLGSFLTKARAFLVRVHISVTRDTSRLAVGVKDALSLLWADADKKLGRVIESQEIGNPKWRRDALTDAGVFGNELDAKDRLLDHFMEEKRFLATLRFLASVLGSLSKIFPVLSAVKEFIDAVLSCRDWLPSDPEITTFGDLR